MKLLQRLFALFRPKNEPSAVGPATYSDEEFLRVMMEQARKRTSAERVAREGNSNSQPPSPLSTAA
jgi:hypothetical protein